MARGQLPKAYLRIDPHLAFTHPDPGSFVRLMCLAAAQPTRGRFREWALVEAGLGADVAARLRDRGDLISLQDGRWYVDGWDEWQEGDLTVGDRMRKLRAKRTKAVTDPSPVTPPDRIPPSEASRRLGVKASETELLQQRPEPKAFEPHPLADRQALIREGYELVQKIAEKLGQDPGEVLKRNSMVPARNGGRPSYLATLDKAPPDNDWLIRTLNDLRDEWRRISAPPPAPQAKPWAGVDWGEGGGSSNANPRAGPDEAA